ncbi:(d)CMP kinase [Cellvibrio japonicus]|uniref:Cytidylate kinase n=1 Tax=Cellvibrio japonicus (strain Ueda107) TaxID=498211 RepID=B3PIH8_CELJU|nr:(d)CMP kinase [Cellvibrio japonicus]ACE84651.1 cytidylate kinase [Cellvibrio japonicus Ueda107]QEI12578.1 (d)CMP kinase [Cellvibrio japonicus]QEI16152.1 (d)CMP kinase [Cellvibrio japonicus]QEI19730.1 (d)CMP kinase [Cellvibrio japonicus]
MVVAPVIAIDGPSGSGKGTLSQMLASRLGYHLLDSGALYRLVALAALNKKQELDDESGLARIAAALDVRFETDGQSTRIFLDGNHVSDAIRTEDVGMAASKVAAYPAVRDALLARQRGFAQIPGLVADGRDMGTTVFPDAEHKIFLTASAEARADRRCKQLSAKGIFVNRDEVIRDIQARDERDINRSVSPLKPAIDAVVIDSTRMTIDEVFAAMLDIVRR